NVTPLEQGNIHQNLQHGFSLARARVCQQNFFHAYHLHYLITIVLESQSLKPVVFGTMNAVLGGSPPLECWLWEEDKSGLAIATNSIALD
ncbi:MAG: hypothetical protein VKJ64_00945, partial [Leptolyngbyaceae bacterium]|nr:hypothetical protein [Leptolyngbyaceae bacterium]